MGLFVPRRNPGSQTASSTELDSFLLHREDFPAPPFNESASVYCLYPDSFGGSLEGAAEQLDYIADLGIRTLWILPALSSPGRDQGFDISDYTMVDPRFGGNRAFTRLLSEAKKRGMQTVFDVAINHCSDQHRWFREAVTDKNSVYRDYFIWSSSGTEYRQAPVVFSGMVDSNWTWNEEAGAWYFHRFYPFQPDLNYANPAVTAEMIRILWYWKKNGVDGFRMDAAHMLWKTEGTDCENLPQVHTILKIFRASLDLLSPGTMLLAEANQPVQGMLDYFGSGDECRGAFHFVLMPEFWRAMAEEDPAGLVNAEIPELPSGCAWFTYLRLHDEVTLDVVPAKDRRRLVEAWADKPLRLFKQGEAFSGRLFDLLKRNPARVILSFHLLFALPGTPVLYYGDEVAMEDNEEYFLRTAKATGFPDARFLHRGPFNTARAARAGSDTDTPEGIVYRAVRSLFRLRRKEPELFRQVPELTAEGSVLVSRRSTENQELVIAANLAATPAESPLGKLAAYEARLEVSEIPSG